ncbi:DUF4998 domain-containing protein [uncultured Pedobacter sp.]|uniref:DUF4998 domain-containing protein n=1 Tax=uncultured Pedobacter sp. TaxID=246139 RepID=UPI0025DEBA8D|nr:DUF4998 domain-containing protein [uncultured Pedobacter sp.]
MKIKSINILMGFLLAVTMGSCSKWDDYKRYTENGETLYPGKLDSAKVLSGRLRVKITGLLPADPKITKCKITWNDGRDSVFFDINKSGKIDTLSKIITVTEGLQNFKIQTYDEKGNVSVLTTTSGTAYGPKYESGLINRPVGNAELLSNGNVRITWGIFDTTTGAVGTWVKYTKSTNSVDSVFVPISESETLLANFKSGTSLTLRTQYRPNKTTIDDFYSAKQTVNVMYDVTASYFVNFGVDFQNSDGGNNRWQTPAGWITTADVRNTGNDIGGLDAGNWLPYKALSMEAGWGLPAIDNGKIYQRFTLPAGKYVFVVTAGDCSSGGTKYITVAQGNELPDINNVSSSAITYKSIDKLTDNRLDFELSASTQVSLGLQAKLPDNGTFLKVYQLKLLYSAP